LVITRSSRTSKDRFFRLSAYRCYGSGRKTCDFGQLSREKADFAAGIALERVLGDLDTLCHLIEESRRQEARTASARPREAARRIAELQNRRKRMLDAFEAGVIELADLRKRTEAIDGELRSLEALTAAAQEVEIDSEAVTALVDVFSSWTHLSRDEKRRLLRAFGIRVGIDRAGQGRRAVAHVAHVRIGSLRDVVVYKKKKRFGIESAIEECFQCLSYCPRAIAALARRICSSSSAVRGESESRMRTRFSLPPNSNGTW